MIQSLHLDNTNLKRAGGGLLVMLLAGALAGCNGLRDETSKTTTPTPYPTPATATATASPAASPTPSGVSQPPDTSLKEAAMTWGHIEEARAQLDKAVEENDLREVHDAAIKIRDSVNALPGKSAALPADKRETLNSQVKEVDSLAGQLGEAGDSDNTEAVHERHKAMNEALDRMKALYPNGMEMMEKGMEMMKMGKEMMDKEMMGKGKDMMDKDTMDKGMGMMDEGMDMMEMGKDMMGEEQMGKDMDMMMEKGMDMMGKGMGMMNKGKGAMDKGMMGKGMHMMENGMHMMGNAKEMMKKGGMKKDRMKKDKMDMKHM